MRCIQSKFANNSRFADLLFCLDDRYCIERNKFLSIFVGEVVTIEDSYVEP